MEKSFYLQEPILFLSVPAMLSFMVMAIQSFSLKSISFLHTYVGFCSCLSMAHSDDHPAKSAPSEARDVDGNFNLQRRDVEMILGRMGLCEQLELEKVDLEEFSNLFAKEEPSLQEVKQAFSVFDENGDGFIDELELQRVLSKLGIAEGIDLDGCRRMIAAHDRNSDGRIDFNEFVKFMEVCLC